jgi:hypothetical protein
LSCRRRHRRNWRRSCIRWSMTWVFLGLRKSGGQRVACAVNGKRNPWLLVGRQSSADVKPTHIRRKMGRAVRSMMWARGDVCAPAGRVGRRTRRPVSAVRFGASDDGPPQRFHLDLGAESAAAALESFVTGTGCRKSWCCSPCAVRNSFCTWTRVLPPVFAAGSHG